MPQKQNLVLIFGFLIALIFIPGDASAANSTGTIEVAFILSEFKDQEYQEEHNQDYFEDLAFNETGSMWDYFDEVSRGMLNIQGTVYGPYELDGNASDYGSENTDFVRDSVEIADDYIDYRDYDAVVVIHSGPGEESSGNSDDIWSVHWPSVSISTNDSGYVIKQITQAPEYQIVGGQQRNPLGVWCHEFGHELELPDLYDTDKSSSGIGIWGVMGAGSWGNNGETPTYFSAWSRYWLGWIEPIVITADMDNIVLKPVETDGDVYLLPIPGNWTSSKEYYLLENRQKLKYDSYLPGEGLLIWHIDEDVLNSNWNSNSVNQDEERKGVDLEEADGRDDLDSKTNQGDDEDPYTSGSFTKETYPNSKAYNGSESGWKIYNIIPEGDNIKIDISFLSKPHAIADADYVTIIEGAELQFYGNKSWDEDGEIVNYTWEFDDGNFSYVQNPLHTFTKNGTYGVKLTVCDNNQLCDSVVLTIFVNKPPITIVTISEDTIYLGEKISFDASESYDLDGEIEFYLWNFDDGFTSNQAVYEHEYRNSGIYNVSLIIIDNSNEITTTYYVIEVINRLPNPIISSSLPSGDTKTIFEFSSDDSFDEDGTIEEWLWDFGDGQKSILKNPSHRYPLPGEYKVNLTIIDDQGGRNSVYEFYSVSNCPPEPGVHIPEGIRMTENEQSEYWKVPSGRTITLDAGPTYDNENDTLQFSWSDNNGEVPEWTFSGQTMVYTFEGINSIILRVEDSREGVGEKIIEIDAQDLPIVSLQENQINIVSGELINLESETVWGEVNLFKWEIESKGDWTVEDLKNEEIVMGTAYNSLNFSSNQEGEYFINVSGRDKITNLWTERFLVIINVYDNPIASIDFEDNINEGKWMTFDGSNSSGLDLSYNWTINGIHLPSNEEKISTLIENGGLQTIGLTVSQNPVGVDYMEIDFYANYKPWGVLKTYPEEPRYGQNFELYLNAYDEESEASIDILKIIVNDYNGNQRAELSYNNQGENFNLIFEIEYTGSIILEYNLKDVDGNVNKSTNTVDVLGWADLYVESIGVTGKREKGNTQSIKFTLANYNESYQTVIYNGYTAKGEVDLLIDSEIVKTWEFEIEGNGTKSFEFNWIATPGNHDFEVVARVYDGEVIDNNNNLSTTIRIKVEQSSGFLAYPNFGIFITLITIIAYKNRRKPN